MAGDSWWPSPQQELLLRAALLQGPRAIEAFERWRHLVDVEELDPDSHRLLPQLYHNLRHQGISDPAMGRFKGVYRRTWYANQLLFQAIPTLLRSFADAGIRTVLLKGVPLVSQYYRDLGLRPVDDFAILVPVSQASPTLGLLQNLGFTPVWDTRDVTETLAGRHDWDLKDATGQQVEVHWRVFPERFAPDGDMEFWAGTVPVTIHGTSGRTLNAADQLLHVCAHGVAFTSRSAVRWVADAMAILRGASRELDWDRLLAQARRRWFILLLQATLTYLRDIVDAPVPLSVLQRMTEMPVPRAERIAHTSRTRPPELRSPWLALSVRYLEHCATLPANAGTLGKLMRFSRFVLHRVNASSCRRILVAVALWGTRRIGSAAKTYGRRWTIRREIT